MYMFTLSVYHVVSDTAVVVVVVRFLVTVVAVIAILIVAGGCYCRCCYVTVVAVIVVAVAAIVIAVVAGAAGAAAVLLLFSFCLSRSGPHCQNLSGAGAAQLCRAVRSRCRTVPRWVLTGTAHRSAACAAGASARTGASLGAAWPRRTGSRGGLPRAAGTAAHTG